MEGYTLAQMECPLGRVIIYIPRFRESGNRLGAAELVSQQRVIDLEAGTERLTVCLITAEQTDRFGALDPDQLTIVGGHLLEVFVQRANFHVTNTGTKDISGCTMGHRDHGGMLFNESCYVIIVSLAFRLIGSLTCSFNLLDNIGPLISKARHTTSKVEIVEVGC